MATNPTPWTRRKLISVLTGYNHQSGKVEHEELVSGHCYCYRVGSDDRIWVHRANPNDRWFGVNRDTRDLLIDKPTTEKWSGTYYKYGYELKHVLIVVENDKLVTRLQQASNPEDIADLSWYAFKDDELPALSTHKRGFADQFYIKLEGSLEKELRPYFQDGENCLPNIETDS